MACKPPAGASTALRRAAASGDLDAVRTLLAHDSTDAEAALLIAATRGFAEIVQLILSAEASLKAVAHKASTALLLAAQHGHVRVVAALLAVPEIDVNALDSTTRSAHMRPSQGPVHVGQQLQLLASAGATALHYACANGHTAVVELLLAAPGVDVNASDPQNRTTPLYFASQHGHVDVVRVLLAAPAIEVTARRASGATPLYVACQNGHADVVALLLRAAPAAEAINLETSHRVTPLHIAALKQHASVVRLLMATEGISIRAKDMPFLFHCAGEWSEETHGLFPPATRRIVVTLLILVRSDRAHTRERSCALSSANMRAIYTLFRWIVSSHAFP